MSSWSSLECSPACHAGDRGFKSHRGRLARYANWQSGEAQTFVTLRVRLPPVPLFGLCSSWRPVKPLSQNKRGGRREVQFLHNPFGPLVYRFRTSASQAGRTGSTRAPRRSRGLRVIHDQAVEWETHDAQNVVPFVAWEFDSPLGHSTQVGQCSAEPHKLGLPGATPGPAT